MPASPGPPVRAATVVKSPLPPFVIKVLEPLSRKKPSSRTAMVRRLATSEPASGSVMARAPRVVPRWNP